MIYLFLCPLKRKLSSSSLNVRVKYTRNCAGDCAAFVYGIRENEVVAKGGGVKKLGRIRR